MKDLIYIVCAGHEKPITQNCLTCSPDYNKNHFPNNFDCPGFQRELKAKYDVLMEVLDKKGLSLTDSVKNMITTHLSLISLINPKKEITDEDIINGILDNIHIRNNEKPINEDFLTIAGINSLY